MQITKSGTVIKQSANSCCLVYYSTDVPPRKDLLSEKIFNFIALDGRSEEKNNESFCYSKTHRYFYKKTAGRTSAHSLKNILISFHP